jgi:predicted 3-demethylubiquinone-9 3-methyltransferase (glyoxalase superfamily)
MTTVRKQKITPFLWFNNQTEEAANYYISIFKDGKIASVSRYGDAGPGPKGSVMTVAFEIVGQRFVALNGGPIFKFSAAGSRTSSVCRGRSFRRLFPNCSRPAPLKNHNASCRRCSR